MRHARPPWVGGLTWILFLTAGMAQAPQVTHECAAVHPLPRPCDDATSVSTWSSIYFEVSVPGAPGHSAKIDPDTVTLTLEWPGHNPLPVILRQRRWVSGYTGEANGEWTADNRMGWGFLSRPSVPLPASTTITAYVRAKTYGGLPIDTTTYTWSFTTRRNLTGSSWDLPIDLSGPTVHWEGRWFAGEVKVNFDSSRMYDQEAVYQLMDATRVEAPEFLLQQRDFPLFGDYWQATIFDGNPNLMREQETRRITSMSNSGSVSILVLTDSIEHALFGIPDNRPLSADYHVGDRVTVCDATQCESSTVRAVNDSLHQIRVDQLTTPLEEWDFKAGHVPPADNPDTPDNFSNPVGALRKLDPVGTPVYYWTRLDDELDQHVAHARRPVMVLHGTPFDACRLGHSDNENGGECPDRPKEYLQWDGIVRTVVRHVIDRYGAQTLDWYWSIGNEPDLPIFWVGTDDEFMAYYDYTANAILRAFEESGLDASRVKVGGGEATGIWPGFEDQLLYHGSPSADFPTPGLFEERNHACIDPLFAGRLATRIATLCAAHENRGTPVDFISVHSYDHADAAAADLQRTHQKARTIDPVFFQNLPVNSHETTPDWIPHRDPDSRDGYRWGMFVSSWGAEYFRRMLDGAMADPTRARGEALMTAWPFNYNLEGTCGIAGQLRIDENGDGIEDRVDAVKTPFWLFAEAATRMSHDVAALTTRQDAGVFLSGWRSVGPADDKILLYAHDKFDTGTSERGGWNVQLELTHLRFPLVEVREYRIDGTHPARAALAALPKRTSTELYRPQEVADFEEAADLKLQGPPTTCSVTGGQLTLTTRLLSQGVVFLDLRRPDPDGDGAFDPDDNCPAAVNPGQENGDGDPRGDACDCAPADAGAFAIPLEIEGVLFDENRVTLRWQSAALSSGPGTIYDVYREREGFGPIGTAPDGICLVSSLLDSSFPDPTIPSPGMAFRYLVRARNTCGFGPWDPVGSALACP